MLQAALSSVPRSGGAHIDGGRAEVAIAAAAIAASNLVGGEEFQSEVWGPEGDMPPVPQDVIRLAAEVIDLLLNGDNDVKDDWSGDPGGAEWFAMMRRLHRVLAGGDSATPADQLW